MRPIQVFYKPDRSHVVRMKRRPTEPPPDGPNYPTGFTAD